ncbi:MAG TPA: TlpA disulfide reductase family protein [Flavobacteriales bacterium]|nr:TlpA disulfide reductase family protein [Flavobacteriales bacterium]HRD51056.1 TlpA disulfide reductase family protein [Flavobacteriales bacterium]
MGHSFPEFSGNSLRGETWSNALFKDKVTLVSFWRIGCGACMLEMPAYDALLDSIRDRRFRIISMAPHTPDELEDFYSTESDASIAQVRNAMGGIIPRYDVLPMCSTKRFKKPGELGVQCGTLEKLFGADGFPVTLIVGPDGIIRHRHEGLPVDRSTMRPALDGFRRELDSLIRAL